jgi:hypothetical protein
VVAVGRGLAGAPTSIVVGTGAAWGVDVGGDGGAVAIVVSRITLAVDVVDAAPGWDFEAASTGVLFAGRFVVAGAPHAVATITRAKIAAWRMFVDTGMSPTLQCHLTPLGAPRKKVKGARS